MVLLHKIILKIKELFKDNKSSKILKELEDSKKEIKKLSTEFAFLKIKINTMNYNIQMIKKKQEGK